MFDIENIYHVLLFSKIKKDKYIVMLNKVRQKYITNADKGGWWF
jgi:hypothetical protein